MVAFQQPILFTLTIPSGATTTQRIVIDGVNGVIDLYDNSNTKTVEIGQGILQIGFPPNSYIVLTANGSANGDKVSQVQFYSANAHEARPGAMNAGFDSGSGIPFLQQNGPGSVDAGFQGYWGINLLGGGASPIGLQPTFVLFCYSDNTDFSDVPVIQAMSNAQTGGAAFSGPGVIVDSNWPLITDVSWSGLSLATGWSNVGGTFQIAQFRLMPDGTVMVRGSITAGVGATTTVATLPVGYRPPASVQFAVGGGAPAAAGSTVRVGITAAGVMTINGLSALGAFGLDGIRFSVLS